MRTEIANINFMEGTASGRNIEYLVFNGAISAKSALIHDNYFRNVNFTVNGLSWQADGGTVIWNNVFEMGVEGC